MGATAKPTKQAAIGVVPSFVDARIVHPKHRHPVLRLPSSQPRALPRERNVASCGAWVDGANAAYRPFLLSSRTEWQHTKTASVPKDGSCSSVYIDCYQPRGSHAIRAQPSGNVALSSRLDPSLQLPQWASEAMLVT